MPYILDATKALSDLVTLWRRQVHLEFLCNEGGTPEQLTSLRGRIEENQLELESMSVAVVAQVLTDLHRIADSVEKLAKDGIGVVQD